MKEDGVDKFYGWIEGYISDIKIIDDEYQGKKYKKLCVFVDDGMETLQLQTSMENGYGRAFCNIIKNVDLTKQVHFSVSYKKDEATGKGEASMFLSQDGKALKWYFTKDNPRDLPLLEKVTFKGKEEWDNSKQLNYYINMLLNEIKPNLVHPLMAGPAHEFSEKPPAGKTETRDPGEIIEPIDDLPF